jgi:probable HAF family extracellular repeat protein
LENSHVKQLVAAFALTLTTTLVSAQATYRIIDLGVLPGGSSTIGLDINNSGRVAGYSRVDFVRDDAFVSTKSGKKLIALGTLGGADASALAINDAGQVTGTAETKNTILSPSHAFLYKDGQMSDLGTLGGRISNGSGINSNGDVVGTSSLAASEDIYHAFVYRNGSMTDLGTLGGVSSGAADINDAGQITGTAEASATVTSRAYLYANGQMRDIGALPGGSISFGNAINNKGHVVGEAEIAGGERRAFLYRNNRMQDLGTLGSYSAALGINSQDWVVGTSQVSFFSRAFLYRNGRMEDLNDLVDAPDWELLDATDINDKNEITGRGLHSGGQRAFVLKPLTAADQSSVE